jgi:hypothetical protein
VGAWNKRKHQWLDQTILAEKEQYVMAKAGGLRCDSQETKYATEEKIRLYNPRAKLP